MKSLGRRRGFSLLEVMVAVGVLGLSLTVILSAQGDCLAKNKRAATMGTATTLARCRMTELEEKQVKLGYPLIDEIDSSNICCNDEEAPGFSCDWKVERVILPSLQNNIDGGGADLMSQALFSDAGPSAAGSSSPLGGLLGGSTNPQLDLDAGLQNIGTNLQTQLAGAGGMQGLLGFVFSLVYPTLKPLMEASIRRITVVVKWKEGLLDRDFTLTQFVTDPRAGGFQSGILSDGGIILEGGAPTTTPGAGPAGGGNNLGAPGGGPLGGPAANPGRPVGF